MLKVFLLVFCAAMGLAVMAALGVVTALCFGLWFVLCPLSSFCPF